MFGGLCHFGNWGSFGIWGWLGLGINLIFWIGLIAGLAWLFVRSIRHTSVPAAIVPYGSGQPTAKEILQAQYARGEITREQYQKRKQDIG